MQVGCVEGFLEGGIFRWITLVVLMGTVIYDDTKIESKLLVVLGFGECVMHASWGLRFDKCESVK